MFFSELSDLALGTVVGSDMIHIEHASWELCSEEGWVLSIEWLEPGSDRVLYACIEDQSR